MFISILVNKSMFPKRQMARALISEIANKMQVLGRNIVAFVANGCASVVKADRPLSEGPISENRPTDPVLVSLS